MYFNWWYGKVIICSMFSQTLVDLVSLSQRLTQVPNCLPVSTGKHVALGEQNNSFTVDYISKI